MTVSLGNGVDIGNLVTAETNPLTGGIELSAGGIVIDESLRSSPLTVATFGDSTANVGTTRSPDSANAIMTAPFPGSGTTILGTQYDKWSLPDVYPMARLVCNAGISGQTTTQMLARDDAAAGIARKATADVVAFAPDVIICRAGSINDVTALTAASTQSDIDAIYTRHVEILSRLSAGGSLVLDEGIFGYSPGSGTAEDIAWRRAAIAQLNARYAAYAATTEGQVVFVSVVGVLANEDGSYVTGVSADGTHLNTYGQRLLSNLECVVLTGRFGKSAPQQITGGPNLIANAGFVLTTAQSYGAMATGYTAGSGGVGITRQNAKVEIIDGKTWQTCEYVITDVASWGAIYFPFDPTTFGIAAGDVLHFECDWFVEKVGGGEVPVPTSEQFSVTFKKSAAGAVSVNALVAAYARQAFPSKHAGHAVFQIAVQEASAALVGSGSECFLKWGTDTAGTYKIGIANPRLVKLA